MEDAIDYVDALSHLAKQREIFEEHYNTVFNNLEEIGYDVTLKMRQLLSKDASDCLPCISSFA